MRTSRPAPSTAGRRGVTLIESLAASVILLTGIIGAMNAIVLATRQDQSANRFTRAADAAYQVRSGLELQGATRLRASGGALKASCSNDTAVKALAFGLDAAAPQDVAVAPCVIDLDAFEDAATAAKVVPGYSSEDRRSFRRILVVYTEKAGTVETSHRVLVVVSWREFLGNRNYVVQHLTLLAPHMNNGKTSIF